MAVGEREEKGLLLSASSWGKCPTTRQITD